MKRSSIAIVELENGKVRIRLPDTADGYAIGVKLAEKVSTEKGVAVLHRKRRRT